MQNHTVWPSTMMPCLLVPMLSATCPSIHVAETLERWPEYMRMRPSRFAKRFRGALEEEEEMDAAENNHADQATD